MSTYLQLCKDACRECYISGGDTVPTAVTGQTGELQRIVKWVADAYTELQNRHVNWRWLRHGFTLNTTASDDTYAPSDCTDTTTSSAISRFGRWRFEDRQDPPKSYLTASGVGGQTWMHWQPWEYFRSIYKIGNQNDAHPLFITFDPQNNMVLGPAPNDIYTITGDYFRSAQVLAADADEPEMPSQYHKLIVYMVMQRYGYAEAAQEVLAAGKDLGGALLKQLEIDQLPEPITAEPLA